MGTSDRGVKLTTHLQIVPRSKNAWSYTSTPTILLHGLVLSLKITGTTSNLPLNVKRGKTPEK